MDTDKMLQEIRTELRRIAEHLEKPLPPQRMFSKRDAAKVLGVSPTKLKRWIRRGIVVPTRPDPIGHSMIALSEIERVSAGPPPEKGSLQAPKPASHRAKKAKVMAEKIRASNRRLRKKT